MDGGLFTSAAKGYFSGAKHLWLWFGQCHWLLKPIALVWVPPVSLVLMGIGCILYCGVVFDLLAGLVDGIRNGLLQIVARTADNMENSRAAYFFAPLIIIPVTPLIVIGGLLPKIGLADVLIHHAHASDYCDADGGYFQRAAWRYQKVAAVSARGIFGNGVLFFPFAALTAAVLLPWAIACLLVFWSLRLLDWASAIIDWMRDTVVGNINSLARGAGNGLLSAVICPVFLVALLPVYLAVLLVPKFATNGHEA